MGIFSMCPTLQEVVQGFRMMSALPFSVSPDAAAWILDKLQNAENEPALVGLRPILYFALNYQSRDHTGQLLAWCPYPFFSIGWVEPETAVAGELIEIEVLGKSIFVAPDTWDRLENAQLILETINVGYPTPADIKMQLLQAVPERATETPDANRG
jgi:hypothetical protein